MNKKIKDFITQDLKNGIKNLIKWFPVIWKDRQWDYYYIFAILNHKLKLTENFTRNHGNHIDRERDADQIKECITILNRLMEDDYLENTFSSFHKKWGEAELNFTKVDDPKSCEVHIDYPNVKTPEDEENVDKEFKENMEKTKETKNKDLDMLFQLMRNNIEGWWD